MATLNTFKVGICRRDALTIQPRRIVIRAKLSLKVEEIEVLNSKGVQVHDFGTRFLYEGCYGSDVKELQQYLKDEGYFKSPDGCTSYFGKVTKDAVKRWQKDHDVESSGNFGPKSREAYDLELRKRLFFSPNRRSPADTSQNHGIAPGINAIESKLAHGWIPPTAATILVVFLAFKAVSATRKAIHNKRIHEQLVREDRHQQLSRWKGTVQQDGNT